MSGSLKLWMPRLVDCTQRLQQAAEKEPPSSWDGLQVAALGPPGKGKLSSFRIVQWVYPEIESYTREKSGKSMYETLDMMG